MESGRENLDNRVSNLEMHHAHINEKVDSLEDRFSSFENRVDRQIEAKNREVADLNGDVADLKAFSAKFDTTIEFLGKSFEHLGNAIKESNAKANIAYEHTVKFEATVKVIMKLGSIAAAVIAAAWAVYTQFY
jgi:chromosome segregation ATPase